MLIAWDFPLSELFFCRGLDIRVPQAVDVQVQGQVVLFENQLEPPGESAGVHGQVGTVTAENIILWGERASSWSSISPLQKERYSFKRLAISREK